MTVSFHAHLSHSASSQQRQNLILTDALPDVQISLIFSEQSNGRFNGICFDKTIAVIMRGD